MWLTVRKKALFQFNPPFFKTKGGTLEKALHVCLNEIRTTILISCIPRQGPKSIGNLQPPTQNPNFGFYCIFTKEFFVCSNPPCLPMISWVIHCQSFSGSGLALCLNIGTIRDCSSPTTNQFMSWTLALYGVLYWLSIRSINISDAWRIYTIAQPIQ